MGLRPGRSARPIKPTQLSRDETPGNVRDQRELLRKSMSPPPSPAKIDGLSMGKAMHRVLARAEGRRPFNGAASGLYCGKVAIACTRNPSPVRSAVSLGLSPPLARAWPEPSPTITRRGRQRSPNRCLWGAPRPGRPRRRLSRRRHRAEDRKRPVARRFPSGLRGEGPHAEPARSHSSLCNPCRICHAAWGGGRFACERA